MAPSEMIVPHQRIPFDHITTPSSFFFCSFTIASRALGRLPVEHAVFPWEENSFGGKI